jgi:hypothetical protein
MDIPYDLTFITSQAEGFSLRGGNHFRLNFKPLCISQYNVFLKGVDRADQYLAYSLLRKTVKWTKKVALWLINCALFNSFLVYKTLNPGSKLKYKEFLVLVAKAWAADEIQAAQTQTQCDLDHQLTPHIGLMWMHTLIGALVKCFLKILVHKNN